MSLTDLVPANTKSARENAARSFLKFLEQEEFFLVVSAAVHAAREGTSRLRSCAGQVWYVCRA